MQHVHANQLKHLSQTNQLGWFPARATRECTHSNFLPDLSRLHDVIALYIPYREKPGVERDVLSLKPRVFGSSCLFAPSHPDTPTQLPHHCLSCGKYVCKCIMFGLTLMFALFDIVARWGMDGGCRNGSRRR